MERVLEKKVEEQSKMIEFMRKKYKENTGKDIELPQTWEKLLNIPEEDAPIIPLEQALPQQKQETEITTFAEAVTLLNLPAKLVDTKKSKQGAQKDEKKKAVLTTNFDATNKFHMIESINLSGYHFKKFSKSRFRQFIECIVDMRCLNSLVLQNNGIDDSCVEQVDMIFNIKRITRLDLSRNKMDKLCGSNIAKALSSSNHLEWLDLSRNYFNFDFLTLNLILNSIKLQTKMFHFCIDIQESKEAKDRDLPASFTSVLKTKLNLHSVGIIDTKLSPTAIKNICASLQNREQRVTCLNFSFCYIGNNELSLLCRSININRTLIKLSLGNNGLNNAAGVMIANVLENNIILVDLDLKKNRLGDNFAFSLAKALTTNEIITTVDISGNLIESQGAERLIGCLTESNDTLESLGDISESLMMGAANIQKLKKALKINYISKEVRKKVLIDQTEDVDAQKVADSQTLAFLEAEYNDYKLVKPIAFTNAYNPEKVGFRLWNIY